MRERAIRSSASSNERGVIGLLTVVVLGSLLLISGLAFADIGRTDIILAGDTDRAQLARWLTGSCVEEALLRLKRDDTYAGGVIPIGDDTCSVAIAGTGGTRTVTAGASSGVHSKTVEVTAVLKQNLAGNAQAWSIEQWTELDP